MKPSFKGAARMFNAPTQENSTPSQQPTEKSDLEMFSEKIAALKAVLGREISSQPDTNVIMNVLANSEKVTITLTPPGIHVLPKMEGEGPYGAVLVLGPGSVTSAMSIPGVPTMVRLTIRAGDNEEYIDIV